MKHTVKKTLALTLAAALTTAALAVPVAASAAVPAVHPYAVASVSETAYETALLLDPRFTHFSRISSGLDINSLGRADCTGSYTIYKTYSYDSTLTVTLQRKEDSGWVDVMEWTKDYTDTGTKVLNKGYYVTRGTYRLVTVAQIFDDDGTVLETISCDSPIKEY